MPSFLRKHPKQARVLASISLTKTSEVAVSTTQQPLPFWKQPAIYVTGMIMPLVYICAIMVLWPGNNYTESIRVMVITAIVSGALGAITGFWLASSYSSSKKDDAILGQAISPQQIVSPPVSSPTTIINQPGDQK